MQWSLARWRPTLTLNCIINGKANVSNLRCTKSEAKLGGDDAFSRVVITAPNKVLSKAKTKICKICLRFSQLKSVNKHLLYNVFVPKNSYVTEAAYF